MTATSTTGPSASNLTSASSTFAIVATCFLLSGFAALLYETVWLRQFAILLGTSEQALAIVLASYMGGLAIGAYVAGKFVDRIGRPLLTYGVLELGIAVTALLVPVGLMLVRSLQAAIFGGLAEPPDAGGLLQGAFTFVSAFGLIAIPTGLMGATLPLLARHTVREQNELGPRIGILYAINTLGAVAGTLTAAFFCLPAFGLKQTTWIGASVNILVFGLVILLVRSTPEVSSASVDALETSKKPKSRSKGDNGPISSAGGVDRTRWILLLVAISGAVSFCYEIVFTRMLGHVLGGSLYSFATMLSGFLLGIALGGAIASRFAVFKNRALVGFVYVQALIAIAALLAYSQVDQIGLWGHGDLESSSITRVQVISSILVLLPTATCIGATFPFAVRIFARDENDAASGSAHVYSWNVVGGIFGAIITGVLLMPLLQYHGAVLVAVLLNLALSVAAVWVLGIHRKHFLAPAIGILCLVLWYPTPPGNIIRVSALSGHPTPGSILFNHVGRSATVSVFYNSSGVVFQTNGLPETTLAPRDSGTEYLQGANWLTSLPPLLRPSCESMLVIGMGGGAALEQVPPSVKSIDVIELEPTVVEANRRVASLRTRDPLSDPRLNVILNDGRNALSMTSKKYDAIVSQPSHPWTAGASHLYTREFAELVRARLNPRGVFLQWMAAEFVSPALANSMGATLREVYPHVRMYLPRKGLMLFVASDSPMKPESLPATKGLAPSSCVISEVNREFYHRLGIATRTDLVAMLGLDEAGLAAMCEGAELITDERNLLAMRAPDLVYQSRLDATQTHLASFSPFARSPESLEELCPTFDRILYVKKLTRNGRVEHFRRELIEGFDDPADQCFCELISGEVFWEFNMERVRKAQSKFPNDGRFAFMILRAAMTGKLPDVTDTEKESLRLPLSNDQLAVVRMMEATFSGDWKTARSLDERMRSISKADIAFDSAVVMQVPWRLESSPSERTERCREAVEIIDNNVAYFSGSNASWFRVAAAVAGKRPLAALATASIAAQVVQKQMTEDDSPPNFSMLRKIRATIADPRDFSSLPAWKYQEVIQEIDKVLAPVP